MNFQRRGTNIIADNCSTPRIGKITERRNALYYYYYYFFNANVFIWNRQQSSTVINIRGKIPLTNIVIYSGRGTTSGDELSQFYERGDGRRVDEPQLATDKNLLFQQFSC